MIYDLNDMIIVIILNYVYLVLMPVINSFHFVTGIWTDSPAVDVMVSLWKLSIKHVIACECEDSFKEGWRK